MDAPTLHAYAVDGLIKELGLKDTDRYLLEGHIEFRDAEPGITILKEGCTEVGRVIELHFFMEKYLNDCVSSIGCLFTIYFERKCICVTTKYWFPR